MKMKKTKKTGSVLRLMKSVVAEERERRDSSVKVWLRCMLWQTIIISVQHEWDQAKILLPKHV